METKQSILKAEEVFFEYMGISKYPAHRIILNSSDIVQMIATGIEQASAEPATEERGLSKHAVNISVCDHRYHSKNGRYMLYEGWCQKCGNDIEQTEC